jgi:hypothetical protein
MPISEGARSLSYREGFVSDLIVHVIKDFASARQEPSIAQVMATYAEGLYKTYGKTFAETFSMVYGEQYQTTTMDQLTTDWIFAAVSAHALLHG